MKFIILIGVLGLISCNKNNNTAAPVPRNGNYSNGQLSTGRTSFSGVSAPPGYTWSEAQYNTTTNVTNTVVGIASSYTSSSDYRPADDFIVPAEQTWKISKIAVYAIADTGINNPYDVLRIQIWNGNPSVSGSSVVFGDLTTNRLNQSLDSMICPIQSSILPAPGVAPLANTTIWKLSANVNTTLPAGTYWLVYQVHHINNIPSFSPLVKLPGQRNKDGWNAIVYNSIPAWQTILDPGRPVTYPMPPQDLPFEITYTY